MLNKKAKLVKNRISISSTRRRIKRDEEKKRKFLPIIISISSLVVAIAGTIISFWFNHKNFSKQYDEDLKAYIYRAGSDYITRIIKGGNNKVYIAVNFDCTLINNSEKPVLIEQFESTSFDQLRFGWGLYDITTNEMIKFPVKIDSKESRKFKIQEMMLMDTVAYSFVKSKLADLDSVYMKEIENVLLENRMDIFGCKLSITGNQETIMVASNPDSLYNRESFIGKFTTTNGEFSSKYSYYFNPDEKW